MMPVTEEKPSICDIMLGKKAEAGMKKAKIQDMILRLLRETEEEDIGISLYSTVYQNGNELIFFTPKDRHRVIEILNRYSAESNHHKQILGRVVQCLGERLAAH